MKINEFRQQYPQYDDMSDRELATKLHAAHYSDMPFEEFADRFGVAPPPKAKEGPKVGYGLGLGREALGGATFEFADELGLGLAAAAAKGSQLVGLSPRTGESVADIYRDMRGLYGAERGQFQEDHPVAATTANIGGAVATGGVGGAKLLAKLAPTTALGKTAAISGVGAAEGAAFGAGAAEPGQRLEGAGKGAAVGAVVAPVASKVGNAVANTIAKRSATKEVARLAPTREELEAAARQAFDEADNLGVTLTAQKAGQIQSALTNAAKSEGFNSHIHPKVAAALNSFDDLATDVPTLSRMEQQRRILGAAAKSLEPDERRIASRLIDQYDDMIGDLKVADVVSGDAARAGEVLETARGLWHRQSKLRVIEEAVEKAKNQASGYENGLRTQFRAILNSPKRLRGFTPDEREAMKRIVRGGPGENIAKFLGRFGPAEGSATNVVGSLIGAAAGGSVAGGPGAAAALMGGQLARNTAQRMTRANVEKLERLVATGRHPGQIVGHYSRLAGPQATPQELAKILVSAGQDDLLKLSAKLNTLSGNQRRLAMEAFALIAAGKAGLPDEEEATADDEPLAP